MTELAALYTPAFYNGQSPTSFDAGSTMLPPVLELVRPASLVDIGCGVGTWLAAAEKHGVGTLVGVEGPWVRAEQLKSPRIRLVTHDLERPLPLKERFDLAMSVEVAEHLSHSRADALVGELCALSQVVLFGAAIPGQGGVNHINEEWQSAWAARFAARGYRVFDLLRPRFWQQREIPVHYRQNTLLYVHESRISELEARHGAPLPVPSLLDVAHPEVLIANTDALYAKPTVSQSLLATLGLPMALLRSLRRRLS
jgi:SAM-dependent methyltransferase